MVWHAHMFFFLSHVGRGSPWRSRCTRNAIRKPCATWNCWGYGTVIRHHMHHWRLCDLQSRIQNPAILPWTGYGHWQWRSHHSMVASWNEQRSEFESWQKKGNFGFVRRMASLWRVSSRWTGTFAPLGRQVFKDPSLGIPFGIWSLLAICHIGPDHGSGHCWLDRVQTLQHQKRCHVPRPSTHANGGLNMSALGHAMLQASCHAFFRFRVCHFDIHSNMFFSRFVMPNLTCQATTCFMSVMCVCDENVGMPSVLAQVHVMQNLTSHSCHYMFHVCHVCDENVGMPSVMAQVHVMQNLTSHSCHWMFMSVMCVWWKCWHAKCYGTSSCYAPRRKCRSTRTMMSGPSRKRSNKLWKKFWLKMSLRMCHFNMWEQLSKKSCWRGMNLKTSWSLTHL